MPGRVKGQGPPDPTTAGGPDKTKAPAATGAQANEEQESTMANTDVTKTIEPGQYVYGEQIRVSFDATVLAVGEDGTLVVRQDDLHIVVPSAAELRRIWPADGEPQPGELWRDRAGGLWFARWQSRRHERVVLVTSESDDGSLYHYWEDIHGGALGPITRIYQPGPTEDVFAEDLKLTDADADALRTVAP